MDFNSKDEFLDWEIIEFGVYLPNSFDQPGPPDNKMSKKFYSFWSFSGQKEASVYFSDDRILINCRKCEPKEDAFRITMLKNIIKKIYYESQEERSILYFQMHHPPSFYRENFDENESEIPSEKLKWIVMQDLKDLTKEISDDELLTDYFLTNLVIKVTGKDWKMHNSEDNFTKIATETCLSLPPRLTNEDLLQANLTFDIKYLVRVWLSHRITTIFELSRDFLTKMEKLDQRIVEKTCLDIAKVPLDFYCKEKRKFSEIFQKVYQKNERLKYLWENLQEYPNIYAPKSITITPNLIIYNVGLPVLSNAVFQSEKYRREIWKILRVKFRENDMQEVWRPLRDFGEERIGFLRSFCLLGREYEFLAYSATQLRKCSVWMCLKDGLAQRIRKDIGDLSKILVMPKYAARLGQLFSSSFGSFPIQPESALKNIKEKKSEWKDAPFSEGIGKISKSLMNEVQLKYRIPGKVSAIQIRLGGIKGVLTVDPELEGDQICFRDSMKKWPSSAFEDSLTLLNYSKYEPAYLFGQIIDLLSFLGIEDQVFLDIQQENVKDLLEDESRNNDLPRYVRNCAPFPLTAQFLRSCFEKGIDLEKEPFLQGIRRVTTLGALINILGKRGLGPFVKDGAVLFGVLDEYDILEENEIYVCVSPSNGEDVNDIRIIEGETIVTKVPCLYPGDIRKLKAVGKEKVGNKFDHIVNCIVFPAKGERPVTNMISGSDLDGDTYFVSWDLRLIPKETVDAISYNVGDFPEKLKGGLWEKKDGYLEEILRHFEKFWREKTGLIMKNCLRFLGHSLDKGDHKNEEERASLLKKLEEMTQVFSLAVDYAKSGQKWNNKTWVNEQRFEMRASNKVEDHENESQASLHHSQSVIWKLSKNIRERNEAYVKKIEQYEKEDEDGFCQGSVEITPKMIIPGFQEYLQLAFDILALYYEETLAFMNFNEIKSEYEIFCGCFLNYTKRSRHRRKKVQDLDKLQENCMVHIALIQKKSMSLIESELEKRKLDVNDPTVRNKVASAVYIMTYYNEECVIEKISLAIEKVKNRERFVFDFDKIPQLLGLPWYLFKDFLLEKLL